MYTHIKHDDLLKGPGSKCLHTGLVDPYFKKYIQHLPTFTTARKNMLIWAFTEKLDLTVYIYLSIFFILQNLKQKF